MGNPTGEESDDDKGNSNNGAFTFKSKKISKKAADGGEGGMENEEDESDGEQDNEDDMMALLGFKGFDSTKVSFTATFS